MTDVVHVKDSISVDSDRVVWIVAVGHTWIDHGGIVLWQPVWKILDLFIIYL